MRRTSSKSEYEPECSSSSGRTFDEGCLFLYEAPPLPWPNNVLHEGQNCTQSKHVKLF